MTKWWENSDTPLCVVPLGNLDEEDYTTVEEEWQGNRLSVTHFSDGSTTYNFGGPAGPASYDKYGEEC